MTARVYEFPCRARCDDTDEMPLQPPTEEMHRTRRFNSYANFICDAMIRGSISKEEAERKIEDWILRERDR